MEILKEPVVVELKKVVRSHVTNEDGNLLFNRIHSEMAKGNKVIVDMMGVPGLNTSFVNSAFIQLLEHYSYSTIKDRLGLRHTNKQINNIIRNNFIYQTTRGEFQQGDVING